MPPTKPALWRDLEGSWSNLGFPHAIVNADWSIKAIVAPFVERDDSFLRISGTPAVTLFAA